MRRNWALAPVLVLFAATCAFAQGKPCTPAEAAAAEKAVDRVVNWEQLYRAYKDYRHCDTGNVEEVFTEALLRCIVDWRNVEGLAKPMQSDAEYREFVIRHLASPAAKADADAVYSRAKMSCPSGLSDFCGQIASAVRPAAADPTQLAPMAPMAPVKAAPASPAPSPPAKK